MQFVDVYSPNDPYPSELWVQVTAYFENLGSDDSLPGGRYACGQMLMQRCLSFLAGRSLGQVCHIVQLAISQRKILGYYNGTLVPYMRSRSKFKEQCAGQQQPCIGSGHVTTTMPLATLETARSCLIKILDTARGPRPGTVPLSNVKRLFRSRFRLDLSETALGQSKLCDLLQDSQFQDICEVRLESNGYTVIKRTKPCKPTTICLADELFAHNHIQFKLEREPHKDKKVRSTATNDCKSVAELMCLLDVPMICTEHSEVSLEGALATDSPIGEFSWANVVDNEPMFQDSVMSIEEASHSSKSSMPTPIVAHNINASGCVVHNSFIHIAPVPPTPVPGARRRAKSLPADRSVCSAQSRALKFTQPAQRWSFPTIMPSSTTPQESTKESEPRRVLFCQDEPLDFEVLELHVSSPRSLTGELDSPVHSPKCVIPPMQVCLVPPTPLCLMPPTPSPICCSSNESFCKIMTSGLDQAPGLRRLKFCPDEPLDLSDADSPVSSISSEIAGTLCYVSAYSPQQSPLPATSPAPWKLVPPTPSPRSCPTHAQPPLGRLLGQQLCPPGLQTSKEAIFHLSQVLHQQQCNAC